MPKGRKRNLRDGHWYWRIWRKKILFPSAPVGPFCFLRQNRHADPQRDRRREAIRTERRFKLQQRESLYD
jgi:hypothetical protein